MESFTVAANKTVKVDGTTFAYRDVGPRSGVPVIFLHHLTAVLDDWDPAVVDGIAKVRRVITFDNRGVGASEGTTPDDVSAMAHDAIAFIGALGFTQVDLLGYSLGGFIAQVIVQERPALVRKIILAGTSPAGGEGISKMGDVLQAAVARAQTEGKHPKNFLFFSSSVSSQQAAASFLSRLGARKERLDAPIRNESIYAQVVAITKWGMTKPNPLSGITQPVLVVNGDDDVMAPTVGSFDLFLKLPRAELSIFPDAGHGAIFQYHAEFVQQALTFLAA